jgi:hypothetical protein
MINSSKRYIYNRKRHLELLERENDYKKLGKSFFKEEYENWVELSRYNQTIYDYISWENHFEFTSFVEDFLNKTISGKEFLDKFNLFRAKIRELYDEMIQELHLKNFEDVNFEWIESNDNNFVENLRDLFLWAEDAELDPNDNDSDYQLDSTELDSELYNGGHPFESEKIYQLAQKILEEVKQDFLNKDKN